MSTFIASWTGGAGQTNHRAEFDTEAQANAHAADVVRAGARHCVVWELDGGGP